VSGQVGERASAWVTGLLWLQGIYYFATGVWPLVSIRTFQMVTGPKTDNQPTGLEADHWLVMTAGVLITAMGASLLSAAWRRSGSAEVVVLAIAAALGLTAIDVIYVYRQVIEPIYLVDAAAEVVLVLGWLLGLVMGRLSRGLVHEPDSENDCATAVSAVISQTHPAEAPPHSRLTQPWHKRTDSRVGMGGPTRSHSFTRVYTRRACPVPHWPRTPFECG